MRGSEAIWASEQRGGVPVPRSPPAAALRCLGCRGAAPADHPAVPGGRQGGRWSSEGPRPARPPSPGLWPEEAGFSEQVFSSHRLPLLPSLSFHAVRGAPPAPRPGRSGKRLAWRLSPALGSRFSTRLLSHLSGSTECCSVRASRGLQWSLAGGGGGVDLLHLS